MRPPGRPTDFSAVILAGGSSSRMGHDKAWIEVAGQPLLAVALNLARDLGARELLISGRAGADYSGFDCPVLFDLEPGLGPLGGIERALRVATEPLLLVLAVDLPRLTSRDLRRLQARCDRWTGAVPRTPGGLEPLAAFYPTRCHELAVRALADGRHAARDFAAACLRERALKTVRFRGAAVRCFANCNSPDELDVLRRDACGRSTPRARRIS